MKRYIPPIVKKFTTNDLLETIGPTQMASIDLDLYRGTMLKDHSKKEIRFVKQGKDKDCLVVYLDRNSNSPMV